MRSCHCDAAEFVTCTMSHLCCVIQCPRCVACVSSTVQCLLRHRACNYDLAMRVVVCMLLWCACVYLACHACLECARHEDAMSGGERLAAFRVHALLQCVEECSSVMRAVCAAPRSSNPTASTPPKMLFHSLAGPPKNALSQPCLLYTSPSPRD